MANMQMEKTPMPEQEANVRNANFKEVALGYTLEQAQNEAQRCLNCKNKPCVSGCPVGIPIPEFVAKVAEGDLAGAYQLLSDANALPAISGRVCPQESQCEGKCVRGIKGEPVSIGRIERFVADWAAENGIANVATAPKNGHKVAVIGSGPAGLTCAGELARMGYSVSVFEAFHTPGGVLSYGIPEFRLPKAIVKREVANLENKASAAAVEECQLLDKLWESYELSHEAARAERVELESVPKAQRRIGELKRSISALGSINPDAVEEFARVNERYTYFTGQRDDVAKAKKELQDIIAQITGEMTAIFKEQFALIDQEFRKAFAELFGGGKAELILDDPEDVLGCGIEIRAQPPGKTIQHMSSLSGGERALIAIALYFAILKVRPTPFCVMDEIEAALDESNVVRYARYMRRMSGKTQFIVITHRRGTMEEADVLYGVTMQEKGVSRMLTIDLNDVEKELDIK